MSKRARILLLLIVGGIAIAWQLWQREQTLARYQQAADTAERSRAGAQPRGTTLESVRAAWRAELRLPPDRRCLLAISVLDELGGGTAAPATARFDDATSAWVITSGRGATPGSVPELPDIDDCYRLLGATTANLDVSAPAADAFAGPDRLLEALRALDDGTPVSGWPAERVERVATALLLLHLQGMDRLDLDPRLPALVLAFDALATQRSGAVRAWRRALIAHLLGYGATAHALASRLEESDPVRLFVLRDDGALHRRAAKVYSDDLLNYLVLRRMAERHDYEGWSDWMGRYTLRDTPPWTVWQTAMLLNSFRQQQYADVVPHVLAMQMRFLAQRESMQGWFAKIGLKAPAPSVFALLDTLVLKTHFSAGALTDFEDALAQWSTRFTGSVVSAQLVQSYFKSYFYSTVFMAGRHRLDALNSIPAAKEWLVLAAQGATEVGRAYADWYAQLIAAEEGTAQVQALLDTLKQSGPLGAGPRQQLFDAIADTYLPFGSHDNRTALRAILPFLDSRPAHAAFVSGQLRALLFEVNQSERLFEHDARNRRSDDVSAVLWIASMRGDAGTVRAIASNPQVKLDDRRYAASLLERPLKEPDEALDQVRAAIHRDGLRDYATVRWFAQHALKRGRPAEAREAALAWLNLGLPDPGLQSVIMRATLSDAYFAEGDFERAWGAVEPVLQSGQGSALQAGAWAAARLGRRDESQKIWDYVRGRYKSNATQLEYVKFLWDQRRFAEAASVLAAMPQPLQAKGWAFTVAPAFHEATRGWPDADVAGAFGAIKAKGISSNDLKYLPELFSREGRHELAFRMRQGLHGSQLGHVELLTLAYRDRAAFKGAAPARDWLREQVPPPFLNASSMVFYKLREPDLLWELLGDPHDRDHGEWVWLIRAAAAVRDREQSPERLAQLRDYFDDDDEPVELMGSYLLGLSPEAAMLRHAWPAANMYEAAYFVGLKSQCEGRLADAADWYQVVVDLAAENKGEFHWAQDQLYGWYSRGQMLRLQPDGCGPRPPEDQGSRG